MTFVTRGTKGQKSQLGQFRSIFVRLSLIGQFLLSFQDLGNLSAYLKTEQSQSRRREVSQNSKIYWRMMEVLLLGMLKTIQFRSIRT